MRTMMGFSRTGCVASLPLIITLGTGCKDGEKPDETGTDTVEQPKPAESAKSEFVTDGSLAKPAAAATPADPRSVWLYGSAEKPGYFVQDGESTWMEINDGGNRFMFDEKERTEEHIELLDSSRGIGVRLLKDLAQWKSADQENWNNLVSGEWVSKDEILSLDPTYDYRVRLICFVAADRKPVNQHADKIRVIMDCVNRAIRQSMARLGHDDRGLLFQEENGKPKVHLIRGKRNAAYYNGRPGYDRNQQWQRVMAEVPETIARHRADDQVVVFTETYDPGSAKFEWPGGIALGGSFGSFGGAAVFSD